MTPEQENKWEEDLRELQRHTPKKGLFSNWKSSQDGR